MSTITIDVHGAESLTARLNAIADDDRGFIKQAVIKTAFDLHGNLVERLSQTGTGRTYKRRSVTHVASAPGEPPAVDTGVYRGSWGVDTTEAENLRAAVFTNDERGPWLEYGTANMAPRPHVGPSVEFIRPKFDENLEAALARTIG